MAAGRPERHRVRMRNGYRSIYRRAAYSAITIASVLAFGTVALHYLEHYSYLDAFYFMSMLATGEGPSSAPATVTGKIFVSMMAFVSVGSVVVALLFLFGPFLGRLIRMGEEGLRKEERVLEKDIDGVKKGL